MHKLTIFYIINICISPIILLNFKLYVFLSIIKNIMTVGV